MTTDTLLISDATTGKRLAAARNALVADEKAREYERRGYTVRIDPAPALLPPVVPAASDVPEGYELLTPRALAASTRAREFERWESTAKTFPAEWGRWGEGHTTANVAYACLNRGLIEIAVPINGRGSYLYRQKPNADKGGIR